MPRPIYSRPSFLPKECSLSLEQVREYPPAQELSENLLDEIRKALGGDDENDEDDVLELYENELSVCPSSKILGYPFWVQNPETPTCLCGKTMEHLLTLSANEFDKGNYRRWCSEGRGIWRRKPEARTALQRPAFDRLDGRQYIFICKQCASWPINVMYQR